MGRKIKVLHVLKSSIYSGAENVAITIINHLDEEFEAAYLATSGEIEVVLKREGIPYYLLDTYSRQNIAGVIAKYQPDIVHAHDFTATVLCAMVRGRFRLISHLHYDPPWTRKWNIKTFLYTWKAAKVSKILVVSAKSYENMVFADRLHHKCEVVGNPIDIDRILKLANEAEPVEAFDLLFIGRLVEQKNPQRFLGIVKKLKDGGKPLKCIILGEGQLWEECEALIVQYGLQDQVKLLGFRKNPYVYMKAAKLLCMTSRWEGYGLVVLEANIVGIPAISTYTSGTAEILGEIASEMCETDEEFVNKIQNVFENKVEYERLKHMARERVQKLQSIDEYIERINTIYQEVLRG